MRVGSLELQIRFAGRFGSKELKTDSLGKYIDFIEFTIELQQDNKKNESNLGNPRMIVWEEHTNEQTKTITVVE